MRYGPRLSRDAAAQVFFDRRCMFTFKTVVGIYLTEVSGHAAARPEEFKPSGQIGRQRPRRCEKQMKLNALISKFRDLHPLQNKYHCDSRGEYAQLTFDGRDLPQWYQGLQDLLGPPVKTEDQPVTAELVQLTEDFGEIFDHQTLFCMEKENQRILAMFWPWRDSHRVTLKIMVSRTQG